MPLAFQLAGAAAVDLQLEFVVQQLPVVFHGKRPETRHHSRTMLPKTRSHQEGT